MDRSRRVALAALILAFAGCSGGGEPPTGSSEYSLRLVSPATIRVADALTPVPDTLVFELLDPSGERVRQWRLYRAAATTGWLRTIYEWDRRVSYHSADTATGLVRLLWLPSEQPEQVLSVTTSYGPGVGFNRNFTLSRRGVPLVADTVVTSGPESVCVQQGGRVACVGPGQFQSTLRWLRFSAPVHSLSAGIAGTCALLTDGNTACWSGVGPDSVVPNDVVHPPFVEFRGSVGRTPTGALWKGVFGSETGGAYPFVSRSWLPIPSDSSIVQLLTDENGLVTCGFTASKVVMCSTGRRVTPIFPGVPFSVTPFQVLRNAADSSVLRAVGGYTSVEGVLSEGYSAVTNLAVLRTPDGTGIRVTIAAATGSSLFGTVAPDSTLPGPASETRACVPALDPQCGPGREWRSVSAGGRLGRVHIDVIAVGHRVTCGVRGVVVCQTTIAGGDRLIPTVISTDTIRLAP
ncbi:MAG: hypothetical protein V4813_00660 [Gemmatimonadota bacterium]